MEFCVGLMNARRIFIHWAAIRLSGDGIARLVTFSELGVLGFLYTLIGLNLGMFIPPQRRRGTRRCGTTPAAGFIGRDNALQPIHLFFNGIPGPCLCN